LLPASPILAPCRQNIGSVPNLIELGGQFLQLGRS